MGIKSSASVVCRTRVNIMKKSHQLVFMCAFLFLYAVSYSNQALSAHIDFDLTHDGGSTTALVPGSVDPLLYSLNVGDDFTYTVSALGDDYWQVNNNFSPFFALSVSDSGTRTGDFSIDYFLDGSHVTGTVMNNLNSSSIHIGNTSDLFTGTSFDEIMMTYELLSSTAATDIIQTREFLISISDYQNNGSLTYISAVPVPAAAWLFGSGLIGLVGLVRRKA